MTSSSWIENLLAATLTGVEAQKQQKKKNDS